MLSPGINLGAHGFSLTAVGLFIWLGFVGPDI